MNLMMYITWFPVGGINKPSRPNRDPTKSHSAIDNCVIARYGVSREKRFTDMQG